MQIDTSDFIQLNDGILKIVRSISNSADFNENEDFFASGIFDSLQSLTLLRNLRDSFRASFSIINRDSSTVITSSLIYSNPTVALLSKTISRLLATEFGRFPDAGEPIAAMQAMFEKCNALFPVHALSGRLPPVADGAIVLLTGSTGSL